MKKKMKQAWIFTLILSVLMTSVAYGGSAASQASTGNTSAESSYTVSGASFSGAAMAQTTHTVSEASYAAVYGSGSGSAYAATPHTIAESSYAGTGSSSASSSYASTTSTSAASSSSSSFAGPGWPWPPAPPAPKRQSPRRCVQVDSIIKSEDVTGIGWTRISKVNVRSLASTKASRVRQLHSAGTEVMVTAEVLNSAGEKWYGVKLYSGYVGYIRADLLTVQLDKKETVSMSASEPISTSTNCRKVIYVIVEPVKEKEQEIVYITPEQAIEMGLLEGPDAANNDETPING